MMPCPPTVTRTAVVARDAVTEIRKVLEVGRPVGVAAQVTGPAGISADLAKVFEGANFRLLGTTALVVAILLIVTYRSPVLWLIPLTIVGLADQVASSAATHTLNALGMSFDQSTTGILSVLVFGAGTDYALLLISRYRDELRRTEDRRRAMARAWRRTGRDGHQQRGHGLRGPAVDRALALPGHARTRPGVRHRRGRRRDVRHGRSARSTGLLRAVGVLAADPEVR
jgi:hypothetical protein